MKRRDGFDIAAHGILRGAQTGRFAGCLVALAVALLAGACFGPTHLLPPDHADFSRYVAIGNSLTAGYQSGGMVGEFQDAAYPVLLASRMGVPQFHHPRISPPGNPSLLHLDFSRGTAGLLPFSIDTLPGRGELANAGEAPFQNLGVPGAKVADFFYDGGAGDYGRVLVGGGSQWTQLKAQHPTFVTFWLGSNDALDAVLFGTPDAMTPAGELYHGLVTALDSIRSTGAKVIAADYPDVENIPYATTVKPYYFDPITGDSLQLFGEYFHFLGQRDGLPPGPLEPGTLVTLTALDSLLDGVGIPERLGGTGRPLPDDAVITPLELARIQERVLQYNSLLYESCREKGIPVVRMSDLFHELRANGYALGGVRHDTRYLFGGIFSLDGVHPTSLGQAIVANEWIRAINANFGSRLQPVDLGAFVPRALPAAGRITARVDVNRVLESWRIAANRVREQHAWALRRRSSPSRP